MIIQSKEDFYKKLEEGTFEEEDFEAMEDVFVCVHEEILSAHSTYQDLRLIFEIEEGKYYYFDCVLCCDCDFDYEVSEIFECKRETRVIDTFDCL